MGARRHFNQTMDLKSRDSPAWWKNVSSRAVKKAKHVHFVNRQPGRRLRQQLILNNCKQHFRRVLAVKGWTDRPPEEARSASSLRTLDLPRPPLPTHSRLSGHGQVLAPRLLLHAGAASPAGRSLSCILCQTHMQPARNGSRRGRVRRACHGKENPRDGWLRWFRHSAAASVLVLSGGLIDRPIYKAALKCVTF